MLKDLKNGSYQESRDDAAGRGNRCGGVPGSLYPSHGHCSFERRFQRRTAEIEYWAFASLCALAWGQGAIFSGHTLQEAIVGPLYLRGVCVQGVNPMKVVSMLREVPMHRLVGAALPLLGADFISRYTRATLLAMDREKAAQLVHYLGKSI